MEGERTMTMKKYTRFLAGVLIMAICVTTWLPVSFAAEKGATVTSTESLVASIGRTMQVSYKMDGSTIIEVTRFTDVDGQNVIMNRSVKKDGTGELVYTKAQKVQKVSLANQDYDVFLKLATSKSAPQTRSATVGSDVTGSQYKHVFVSNLSYTIDNSAMKNKKKACLATKSAQKPVTSCKSSRNTPERANLIFCWCSCSTVSDASQMKRHLS